MTRVNLVPVGELYDQHLMAEYREIPMVPSSLYRSLKAVDLDIDKLRIPEKFCLGTGHVSFFYDKGRWLYARWWETIGELEARGFDIKPELRDVKWDLFVKFPDLFNDWMPSFEDIRLSRQRIQERVAEKPNFYRKTKTAVELI